MRMFATLFILALIVAPSVHAGNVPLGQPFVLGIGERIDVGDLPLIVGFDAVLADSRCPADAICFWEGEATAQLTLSTPGGESALVELHTRSSPFGKSHGEFAAHVVVLRQVTPYPESRGPIDPLDYRVELVVQLDSTVETQATSWSALKGNFR